MGERATTPIQVYLDSSDYSDLSNPLRASSPERLEVLNWLRDAQKRGAIQVRYSIIHVVEACHRNTSSKLMAHARAALMHELSGPHVLKAFSPIIRSELRRATDLEKPPELALDDSGRWYPPIGNLGGVMRADMSGLPRDAAALAGGNRAARRAAKSAYGTPRKQYEFIKELSKDVNTLAALCAKHGIPERIAREGLFPKIFDHRRTDEDVTRLLCSEMFHPQHFVADYIDRFAGAQTIRGSVLNLGDRLIAGVGAFRNALDNARRLSYPDLAKDLATMRRRTRRMLHGFRERLVKAASDEELGGTFMNEGQTPNAGMCAGIEVLAAFVESWLADLTGSATAAGRSPRASDAGDALHAFYLPYVDIWRGDAYACQVVREKASEYGTTVVPNLLDLSSKFEGLLRERSV